MSVFDFLRGGGRTAGAALRVEPTFGEDVTPVAAPAVQASGGSLTSMTVKDLTNSRDIEEFLRRGGGGETASGYQVTPETGLRVAAVHRCVTIIAGAVATLPIGFVRNVGDRVEGLAADDPLMRLLRRRPNDWQSSSQFRRMMQANVLLRGNAYAEIVRAGRRITNLMPLDPAHVKPVRRPEGKIVYEHRAPGRGVRVLSQRDVFHLRGLSINGLEGLSVLGQAREAVGSSAMAERHAARLFSNGATPGSVVEHPQTLSDGAVQRLMEGLEEHRGADNAHKTLVLEEGMKWKPTTMNAKDLQFVELRQLTRRDIAMFFGVPPHMIGDTETTTSWGSGIEQQSLGFVVYTLRDWLTEWRDAIARDLVDDDDVEARFDTDQIITVDVESRWKAHTSALQFGVKSPDEVRAEEGLNPRADGQGGAYYPPPNMNGAERENGDDA